MSELALQLIAKEKIERTGKLDLGYCGLTEIPEEVFELTWLEELVFGNEQWNFEENSIQSKNNREANSISAIPKNIERLIDLKKIILSRNKIVDISHLSTLIGLEYLNLEGNKIIDIRPLSTLTGLKSLNLAENQIVDMSPLSTLTGLESLIIVDCQKLDISFLLTLRSLQSLGLWRNQIVDISPLTTLTGLKLLHIGINQIADISPLSTLIGLESLSLWDNKIVDISPLSTLIGLKSLSLSYNQIVDICPLSTLKGLKTLDLWNNQIVNISPLSTLKGLQILNIYKNQIVDISPLSTILGLQSLDLSDNQIVHINPLSVLAGLESLFIRSNQIVDISPLSTLKGLKTLDLWDNKIVDLSPLSTLIGLKSLNIEINQIVDINPLSTLIGLQSLDLGGNEIVNIRPLSYLNRLKTLNLFSNKIVDITPLKDLLEKGIDITSEWHDTGIIVGDNPLTTPPVEIVERGREAVLDYFEQVEKYGEEPAYEAKILLVGDGGAGKTSLIKKLYNNLHIPEKGNEDTTLGVTVKPNRFFKHPTLLEINIKTNIWDFGGQDIQYMLHQYFLTDDSLYVLVLDNRKGNTRVDYWLRTIDSLCENGKVLIFRNNRVDDVKSTFRLDHYRNEFPNLKIEFTEANLAINDENWDNLQNLIITNCLAQLPIVGKDIIKVWKPIREDIETNAYKNFIRISEFEAICLKHGLKDENEQQLLLVYLHVIGVALHFKHDKSLDDIIFVNPNWITKGLYAILSADLEKGNSGYIKKEDLVNIWIDQSYSSEERSYLLRLILKDSFDICYELQENKDCFVLPMKLSDQLPVFDWNNCENLIYRYRYSLFPYGILNRIIVRLNQNIVDNLVWQEGVIIERNGSQAKIIEMIDKIDGTKNIEIRVASGNINCKKELLTIIRNEVESIHKSSYKNLKVYEMVMCNCPDCLTSDSPGFFEFNNIEKAVGKGKRTIECRKSCDDVDLVKLIGYTFDNVAINETERRLERIEKKMDINIANTETIKTKLDNHYDKLMGLSVNMIVKDDIELIIKEANEIQTRELLDVIMTYFIEFEGVMEESQREIYKKIKETDDLQMKLKLGIPFGNIIGVNFEAEFDIKSWFNRMRDKYEYSIAEKLSLL